MEAMEYAAKAIARDIASLLYDSRVLRGPLPENIIGEMANISRSHIQIYTQALPRPDDLYPDHCVYDEFASSLAESMTDPPSNALDSMILSDYVYLGKSTSMQNPHHTNSQTLRRLTSSEEFVQSANTLNKLINDLTSSTQPRSASMTLPHKWATKQLATVGENVANVNSSNGRAKGATYTSDHSNEMYLARSLTGGTVSTCGSSICINSFSLDAATANNRKLCSARSLLAELTPMLEEKCGNLNSISEQSRCPVPSAEHTMNSLHRNLTSSPPSDQGSGLRAPNNEDSSTSRESDHNRMVFVSWIPRQLRVQHGEKRKAEIHLKHLLRDALALRGLTKVLLFPPKGTHCKLVFEDPEHASMFVAKYGGFFGSESSERWKFDICKACQLNIDDSAFTNTSVTIEWAQPHFR